MEALKVTSKYTEEEILANFEGVDFFGGIMAGLEEALAYEKGKAKAETFARKNSLPKINVVETRRSLEMSQRSFADILGVSKRTVEAWEAGKSNPSPTAVNLIYLISQDHTLADKLRQA